MGQKIIPISLRLNKKKNWHSQWFADKIEYSSLFFFDFEIRKYFISLLNYKTFQLIKLNIFKTSKNINIYLYIHQIPPYNCRTLNFDKILIKLNAFYTKNHIKLFIHRIKITDISLVKKDMKKIFFLIQKTNRMNKNIKKILFIFTYAFYTKNINLISEYIKKSLTRKKTHKKIINSINRVLEVYFKIFSNILGYRLQIKGRVNGIKRKKKLVFQKGKIPLNSVKYDIKYNFNEFKTPSGICSIKFWVLFSPLKKRIIKVYQIPKNKPLFKQNKYVTYQTPQKNSLLYSRYKQPSFYKQREMKKKNKMKKEKEMKKENKKLYVIPKKNKV